MLQRVQGKLQIKPQTSWFHLVELHSRYQKVQRGHRLLLTREAKLLAVHLLAVKVVQMGK